MTKFATFLALLLIPLATWGQSTDRLTGLSTSVAVKAPVEAASASNLTLAGEQTVDGIAVVTGDRVLVKDQTDAVDNGIYVVDTGDWTRAEDFDGARDVVEGTLVVSNAGSNDIYYKVISEDPITIGTSEIEFDELSAGITQNTVGLALYPRSAAEIAVGVTPSNYGFEEGNVYRYGALGNGVADDTTAVQNAVDVAIETGGIARIPPGDFLLDTVMFDGSNFTIQCDGRGSILRASSDIPASGAILLSLAGDATSGPDNQALLDGIYGLGAQSVRTNVTGSIENVQIKDCRFEGNAVAVRGIWSTGFTRGCRIEGNWFNEVDGGGIVINGSWTFSIIANHVEGDGTNGTGIALGALGNGFRGVNGNDSVVVNAPAVIANEVTGHAHGIEWDFGQGGLVAGNTIEGNVGDGFESQSVEGASIIGNYIENNGGDNMDLGGTTGSDFFENCIVQGNHLNNATGDNQIRIDGVRNCHLGPNNFAGTQTQHYFIPSAGGANVSQNFIVVPDVDATYIGNSSELDVEFNTVFRILAGSERISTARVTANEELRTLNGSLIGFFGSTAITQPTAVTAPVGGGTVDAEARTAINSIITKLETLGIVDEN